MFGRVNVNNEQDLLVSGIGIFNNDKDSKSKTNMGLGSSSYNNKTTKVSWDECEYEFASNVPMLSKGSLSPLQEMKMDDMPVVVKYSTCGTKILVGLATGVIKVINAHTCTELYDLNIGHDNPCVDMALLHHMPDTSPTLMVACYSGGYIAKWDYDMKNIGPELVFREADRDIAGFNHTLCCAASLDAQRIATAGDGAVIRVYSLHNGVGLRKCYPPVKPNVLYNHSMRVTCLKYDPRGADNELYKNIFYSAGWDDNIYAWNDKYCLPIWRFTNVHVCGSDGFDISLRTKEIIAANWSVEKSVMKVYEIRAEVILGTSDRKPTEEDNTRESAKILEHREVMDNLPTKGYVAKFCLDSNFIIYGGCNKNMIKIVSRDTLKTVGCIHNLVHGVYAADACNSPFARTKLMVAFITGRSLVISEFIKPQGIL